MRRDGGLDQEGREGGKEELVEETYVEGRASRV